MENEVQEIKSENTPIKWASDRDTAYMVDDYPYGRLRCKMFFWIESVPKKGDRYVTQSINPKNGRENAPHKSTYYPFMYLYADSIGHIHASAFSFHDYKTSSQKFRDLVKRLGLDAFNEIQRKNLRDDLLTTLYGNAHWNARYYTEGESRKAYLFWISECLKFVQNSPFEFMANWDDSKPPERDLDEDLKPIKNEK